MKKKMNPKPPANSKDNKSKLGVSLPGVEPKGGSKVTLPDWAKFQMDPKSFDKK